jgi:hypothetical protein
LKRAAAAICAGSLPTICTERGFELQVVLLRWRLLRESRRRDRVHHLADQESGAETRAQPAEGQVRHAGHGRQGHGVDGCVGPQLQHRRDAKSDISCGFEDAQCYVSGGGVERLDRDEMLARRQNVSEAARLT